MEYALSYANQGYAVFPLQPNGKQPLTEHGFHDASRDPNVIQAWWAKWPEANVGIATGRVSGIVVLDVDRKHGVDGVISATELNLPPTLVIRTPSGGYHLFFKAPPSAIVPRRIGVKPGLDILGEGGYVVAAGSWVNGAVYQIAKNRPIADCPEILINLAGRQNTNLATKPEDVSKVGAGSRNQYLTSIGGKLRRIGFTGDELVAVLLAVNTTRCDPPIGESEVRRTAASVARYAPDEHASDEADQAAPITVRPVEELLAATYPPIEFISEPILIHPGLCLLFGPSGISKTYFALAWAMAVAGGTSFLKWRNDTPRGVLYVDGELGGRTMQQRIRLLQSGHEIIFKAPFYTASFDDQGNGLFPDLEDPIAQLRYAAGIPDDVQLVVLDSLSTLASMEESNDYKSWATIQRLLLGLRRRGLSVVVIHHANKGGNDQSGTSRRIHVMDTVISLRKHDTAEGSSPGYKDVEVHVTKGRNLPPNMAEPFIATLSSPLHLGTAMAWTSGDLGVRKTQQIEELLKTGMPISAIIQETGCASSLAYKIKDRLQESGAINWKSSNRGRKRRDLDG